MFEARVRSCCLKVSYSHEFCDTRRRAHRQSTPGRSHRLRPRLHLGPAPRPPGRCPERGRLRRVFTDKASGTRSDRPQLSALDYARPGDTLMVWRLDRLGRSLEHLVETVADWTRRRSASGRSTRTSTPRPPLVGWCSSSSRPWPSSSATCSRTAPRLDWLQFASAVQRPVRSHP